jgi:hypothetical protein
MRRLSGTGYEPSSCFVSGHGRDGVAVSAARIALTGHVLSEAPAIVIPICAGDAAEFIPQSQLAGDNFPHGAMRPHIASKARR